MKRLMIIALLVCSALVTFAQTGDGEFRFGMQVTPIVSWFTTDETTIVKPDGAVMGYSIGVVGDWFFQENYAITSGLFLNSMGGRLKYGLSTMPIETKNDGAIYPGLETDIDKGEVTLRPTYLEVPVGIKFLSKEFWRSKFYGQCGVSNYFLVNAKMRCDGDLDKKSVKDEFSALMFAFHLGVGVEYALGDDTYLTAGILGTMGLNDVTKSETQLTKVNPVNKINSVNLKLGVVF